ncbi:MAG: hypothetical protein GTN64_08670 [Candidatus Latescibacteria bacterium]|nr:hypothetical protein [Candidatus Latescibacterota bacterium]NIO78672.1 hypothetical protein [Candidatus Latescibacterota bacterium]
MSAIDQLVEETTQEIETIIRGGPGSGHHGHRGRPGKVGGSLPSKLAGDNVSDYFKVPQTKLWEPVNRAFRAIEKVHGILPIQSFPFKRSKSIKRSGTYYTNIMPDGTLRPDKMMVVLESGEENLEAALTTAHEMGHVLDHLMFGRDTYFTSQDMIDGEAALVGQEDKLLAISTNPHEARAYQKWWAAITGSDAYDKIMNEFPIGYYQLDEVTGKYENVATFHLPAGASGFFYHYTLEHQRGMQSPIEFFARSYAQYITTRSGDALMNNELDRRLDRQRNGLAHANWEPNDFEPIAEAFDELFDSLGLLR